MAHTATITERATIPIYSADELSAVASRTLAEARERVAAIEAMPLDGLSAEAVFDAWDRMSIAIEDAYGPISLLNSVHPDAAVRDAGDRALIDESVFMTELFQNETLYERVRAVSAASGAQRQYRKDLLEAFEDSGVSLAPEKRRRFREISERITELAQEFSKNIRENKTAVRFTPAECDGLPAGYVERARKDDGGNIVLGFDYPDYVPFMMNAKNDAARKRYYVAYTNRGTPRNIEILDEIVALRREIAELYEVPSFAHYGTKRRMVGSPETVISFLGEVNDVVTEPEVRDWRSLAQQNGVARGRAVRPSQGHADRRLHRRHLPRSLSPAGQVQARRGVAGARRVAARGAEADQRAGGEPQPRRPHAQRARDVAARVRARAARRALGHGVQPARRHERGARLRGGAVADVRGVGEPPGEPLADAGALHDVPDHRRAAGEAPPRVAQVRQRHRLGPPAPLRGIRHGAV